MGSPVSAVVANLYMESFEEQAITSSSCKPKIWTRYVDDTLAILERGRVDSFVQYLNNLQPSIRFTSKSPSSTPQFRENKTAGSPPARSLSPENRAPVLSLQPSLNPLRFCPMSKVFPNNLDAAYNNKAYALFSSRKLH
ncbi:hypothetical protein ACROYT_G000991 [Oculina patagonica]